MDPKIEIKSTLNIIANKFKLEGVKRKWKSLMSESKLMELDKVLGAGCPYSTPSKRPKLDESPDGSIREQAPPNCFPPPKENDVPEAPKVVCKKKKRQESKVAQQVSDACQKIEEIFEKNGKIMAELEKLNKEVTELRSVVDSFVSKHVRAPRRQFP